MAWLITRKNPNQDTLYTQAIDAVPSSNASPRPDRTFVRSHVILESAGWKSMQASPILPSLLERSIISSAPFWGFSDGASVRSSSQQSKGEKIRKHLEVLKQQWLRPVTIPYIQATITTAAYCWFILAPSRLSAPDGSSKLEYIN